MKTIKEIIQSELRDTYLQIDCCTVSFETFEVFYLILSYGKLLKAILVRNGKYINIKQYEITVADPRDSFRIKKLIADNPLARRVSKKEVAIILRKLQKDNIKWRHPQRFAINKLINEFINKELVNYE